MTIYIHICTYIIQNSQRKCADYISEFNSINDKYKQRKVYYSFRRIQFEFIVLILLHRPTKNIYEYSLRTKVRIRIIEIAKLFVSHEFKVLHIRY